MNKSVIFYLSGEFIYKIRETFLWTNNADVLAYKKGGI